MTTERGYESGGLRWILLWRLELGIHIPRVYRLVIRTCLPSTLLIPTLSFSLVLHLLSPLLRLTRL
jgi:hypothetical protein